MNAVIDDKEKDLAVRISKEIMNMSSVDGAPVIFNAHIGNGRHNAHDFAENEASLPDEQTKFLYTISSIIPKSYKQNAKKYDLVFMPQSRGFISNAKPEKFIAFIDLGSFGPGEDLVNTFT